MNNAIRMNNTYENELDIREIFLVIWVKKKFLCVATIFFGIVSVIFALQQPNTYRAEALLAPVSSDSGGGGLAALATQFGGLASMAGINLTGKSGIDKTVLAIEVLKSRQFIGEFIKTHEIMPDLMALEEWRSSDNTLIYNQKFYDARTKTWLSEAPSLIGSKPSEQKAYKAMLGLISINQSKDTGMVTISVEHKSPYVAKKWVDLLVFDINRVMKERDVAEAIRSTSFLYKQIESTDVSDIRTILYKLVEEQAKTIMFAEVRDEYIFKTMDPAVVPEEKFKPKRAVISLLGTMLGCILSVLFVISNHYLKRKS